MFSHIMFGANDLDASKQFYDAVLGVLGCGPGNMMSEDRCFYLTPTGVFGITKPIDGEAATHANGGTLGFVAKSEDAVNEWHKTGLENGGVECEDPPGIRVNGFGKLYAAYLRDPSGNKICAIYRPKS